MSRLFRVYESLLHRYPITSQAVQTGLIVSGGDVISQILVEKKTWKDYNTKRTFQFFCVGAIFLGPTLTVWYKTLDRLFGAGGKSTGLKKMAVDQICFAPFCLGGFVLVANVFQGQSWQRIEHTFRNTYPELLMSNYKLWPAVQLINFTFVPLHFQVLFVQTVALLWNTYVCYKTRPKDH